MLSLALVVVLSTLSAPAVFGQFTNTISCYYCQNSFIPGNPVTDIYNPYRYSGVDNGCGYPFNSTGNGVIQVSCQGVCVTQVTYDGAGRNSIFRMCSLVPPATGCYNSTNYMLPRTAMCTSTCTTNLCNTGVVPYVAGVSATLPQLSFIVSLLLLAVGVNFSKLLQ